MLLVQANDRFRGTEALHIRGALGLLRRREGGDVVLAANRVGHFRISCRGSCRDQDIHHSSGPHKQDNSLRFSKE